MNIESLFIPDIKLITPKKYEDDRGFFVETFRQDTVDRAVGEKTVFVQENCSFSKHRYTVRGLHAQSQPHAQGKLVCCISGKIQDIVVDVRPGSKTYGQSVSVDLNGETLSKLWIPSGFLHGFITLESDTEVHYKCTDYYTPDCEIHVNWQDPDLNIDWGIDPHLAKLSENDKKAPSFKEFELEFIKPA